MRVLSLFMVVAVITSPLFAQERPASQVQITAKEIPLDETWGYNLPGTRDIFGLPFPEKDIAARQTHAHRKEDRERSIEQIRLLLTTKPPGQKTNPGFVLPALPDSAALRRVSYGIRRKRFDDTRVFEQGEFTLVFFSHPLSYYTRLREVTLEGNNITVHYQFEPHLTPESTVHFALIPLGKLTAGQYSVKYKQIRLDQKHLDAGFEHVLTEPDEIVCRDFSFKIVEPLKEIPPEPGATMIPLDQIWAYEMPGTMNVRELDTVVDVGLKMNPRIAAIRKRLWTSNILKEGEIAGPGFVVQGTGKTAFQQAHDIFTEIDQVTDKFPASTELSFVFYSYSCGQYVWVDSVERYENRIVIKYRFAAHMTAEMTSHFALIPIGRFEPGDVTVEVKQLPSTSTGVQKIKLIPYPESIVSGSTTFRVGD